MAYITSTDRSFDLRGRVQRILSAIAAGLDSVAEARSRSEEFQYLSDLSDAELARRGLKRDEIAYHVYRGKLGL